MQALWVVALRSWAAAKTSGLGYSLYYSGQRLGGAAYVNFMPFFLPTFSYKKLPSAIDREEARGVEEAGIGKETNAQIGGVEETGERGEANVQQADEALVMEARAQEVVEQCGGDQRDRPVLQACSA